MKQGVGYRMLNAKSFNVPNTFSSGPRLPQMPALFSTGEQVAEHNPTLHSCVIFPSPDIAFYHCPIPRSKCPSPPPTTTTHTSSKGFLDFFLFTS